MPNTIKQPGNFDTKTFIKALKEDTVAFMLETLNVHDEESQSRATSIVSGLMDDIGDVPEHPAHEYIELLAGAIERYEQKLYGLPKASPVDVLQFLMEAQGVKQAELKDIFGSQGNVSQVLQGKRELNLKHIRQLAERFHVNPAVFV